MERMERQAARAWVDRLLPSHVLAQTAYYLGLEHLELRTRVIDPVSQA